MAIQLDLINFVKNTEKAVEVETDPSLSAELPGQEPSPGIGFETDVSRAVYSASIMRPIYELEARRFRQGDPDDEYAIWEGLDFLWIAFAILDVISELTEYQSGATRKEVIRKVLPSARRQVLLAGESNPTDEGLQKVLKKVFDHLSNREKRYLPFSYTYFSGASGLSGSAGGYRKRKFWLIKNVYTGAGGDALFRLTDEGYAAYFGLHETSALDAAAIGNLRIKLLIERGNVDDAISVAESNRKQCARKALDVHNIRRQIRRNIHAVDFRQISALADEGAKQATDIQEESSRLHTMVMKNLDTSRAEKYGAKLYHLAERLERLNHQLMKLSGELQDLPDDYRENSHKLFRKRSSGAFPSMDEVMARIFPMEEADAATLGAEFIARIDPPQRRPLFDPAAVIEACDRAMERQNTPGDRNRKVLEVDGVPIQQFKSSLSDKLMQQAFGMIRAAVHQKGRIPLSRLLKDAATEEEGEWFPVAVAMAVFQSVIEPILAEQYRLRVTLPDPDQRVGVDLSAGRRYWGHELVLKYRPLSGGLSRK